MKPHVGRLVLAVVMAISLTGIEAADVAMAAPGDPPAGDRYAGEDRYFTAAALAEHFFGRTAFVASGTTFADALAAAPAAAVTEELASPILLTQRDVLPDATRYTLEVREYEQVVIVGGTAAVSDVVAEQIGALVPRVRRVAGSDRYATAAALALDAYAGPVDTVIIATGENFPDALAAGGAGATQGWPLLLTHGSRLPDATAEALRTLEPRRIIIAGDAGVVDESVEDELGEHAQVVQRAAGADRYETAAEIVAAAFPAEEFPLPSILVSGVSFADALAAGALAGQHGIPMLLVRPDCIPSATVDELLRQRSSSTMTVGGRAAVAAEITAGYPCDGPCPSTDRALEHAGASDPRVCVLLASDRVTSSAWSAFDAELIVRNESSDAIAIPHPSSCAIFYGRFDPRDGTYAGYGPTCSGSPVIDALGPGERRTYPVHFSTGQDDGGWVFAAGLNIGTSSTADGVGSVWFARERLLALASP